MGSDNIQLKYQRTARNLSIACGLLFFAFSFVYLYVFQKNVLEALHFSLSGGKTQFAPFWMSFVLTVLLLLLRWGTNFFLGLKGGIRELTYFPSFLMLGVLTDVDESVYMEGFSPVWNWLLPLVLFSFIGLALILRNLFRFWMDEKSSIDTLIISNLTLFLLLCFMTLGIGNTNIHFHHGLAIEKALRVEDYVEARKVGQKIVDPTRSLTALRAYAMSKEGTLGEYLFQYPQLYKAEGLLLDLSDKKNLRMTPDSLYTYLGASPNKNERALPFFQRLCTEEVGNYTTLDYYFSALLLEKQLGKFVKAFHELYTITDSIPRYYKEALFLYDKMHSSEEKYIQDEAMEQRWQAYDALKNESGEEYFRVNRLRRNFGDTYWWYYQH